MCQMGLMGQDFHPFRAMLWQRAHARAVFTSWSIMLHTENSHCLFKFLAHGTDALVPQEGDPLEYIEHKVRFIKSFPLDFYFRDWFKQSRSFF